MNFKAILFFFLTHALFAQTDTFLDCKTFDKNDRYYNEVRGLLNQGLLTQNRIKTKISVAVHTKIIRKSDGSGGIGVGELNSALSELNNKFAPIGVSFFFLTDDPVYIDSDELYNFDTELESEVAQQFDVTNAVNLYLVNSFSSSIGGFSYFPDDDKNTNRVFSYYQNLNDMIYRVLPHEFGHYFGLFHTFQGNKTNDEEFVTRGIAANCEYGGDLLCDTPADPYGRLFIIGGLDCSFPYAFFDKNGVQYTPATNNMMSYYRGCGNVFTAGQIDMMSYGIARRLAPSSNKSVSYTILGQKETRGEIITGSIVDGNNREKARDICRDEEAFVTFESNLNEGTGFEAWLISVNNKERILIGSGISSPMKVSFKDIPEIYFPFYVQVVTKDESVFGNTSKQSYFLMDIPKIKISGDIEIFKGEGAYFFIEVFGGAADFVVSDSTGLQFEYTVYNQLGLNKQNVDIEGSRNLYVKSVSNQCGFGSGEGKAKITLKDIPTATFVDVRCESNYWCIDTRKEFEMFSLGGLPEINKITVINKDGNFLREIKDYEKEPDRLFMSASESSDLPDEFFIEFSFNGVVNPLRSEKLYLAKPYKKNISRKVEIFRGQSVEIPLEGLVSRSNIEVRFSDKSKQLLIGENPKLSFKPVDTGMVAIDGIINLGCQNIDLKGELDFKIKEILDIGVVRSANSCIGDEIATKIDVHGSFFSERPDVILYNELDIEISRIKAFLVNDQLSFKVSDEIKETGFYYFRVVSLENFISEKSNKFQIIVSPEIDILPVYGKAEQGKSLLDYSNVSTPFKMYLSDGTIYECDENHKLPVKELSAGKYQIVGLENTCGKRDVDIKFTIEPSLKNDFCIPISDVKEKVGTISYLEIKASDGSGIKTRQVERNFFTNYVYRNEEIINLVKGNWYEINVKDYTFELPTYFAGGEGSSIKLWIDLNSDGQFTEEESWSPNSYTNLIRFQIPTETSTGFHILRVRTLRRETENVGPCSKIDFGETRDMILWIDDHQSPALTIQASKELLCAQETIQFSLSSNYQVPENGVHVTLQDVQGVVLKDLGNLNTGNHTFNFSLDIQEFEFGLKLVAEDQSNNIVNHSQKLFVFTPPKLSISKNVYGVKSKSASVSFNIEGGFHAKLDYLYNNQTFTVGLDNYFNGPLAYSFVLDIVTESSLEPLRVYDNVCGQGEVAGKVTVREVEDQNLDITPRTTLQYAFINTCDGTFSIQPAVQNAGDFPSENFFTYVLIDGKGKLIKTLGSVKQSMLSLNSNDILPPGWYYLEVFASKPFSRSYVTSFEVKNTKKPDLKILNNFFEDSYGVLQISMERQGNIFKFNELGISSRISARNFRKKLSPTSTFVGMEYSDSYYSCQESQSVNYEYKASSRSTSKLIAQKNIKACSESGVGFTFLNSNDWEPNNQFEVQMFTSDGSFMSSKLATANGRELFSEPFLETGLGEKYKLRLVSTNPYKESDFTNEFQFGEKLNASFTDRNPLLAYAGISYPLEVMFEGKGPYTLILNDSLRYEGLNDSISTIDFIPDDRTNNIKLSEVLGNCGTGTASGIKPVEIVEKPYVELASFSDSLYCLNRNLEVSYNLKSGVFIDSAQLFLEVFDKVSNTFIKVRDLEGVNNTVLISPSEIPLNANLNTLRVSSVDPELSFNESDVFLEMEPFFVPIRDEMSVVGAQYSFNLGIVSTSDFKIEFNNNIYLTGEGGGLSRQMVQAIVPPDGIFEVTHFENACGEYILPLSFKVDLLSEKEFANQVVIYENPIRRWDSPVTASLPFFGGFEIEVKVMNSKGQLVKTLHLKGTNNDINRRNLYQIDVSDLSSGEYFLLFYKDGISFSKKIVVI